MMKKECRLILDEFMELGECPLWDDREQMLYWVDTDYKRVYSFDPESRKKQVFQLDQKTGSIAKENSGSMICALEDGIYRLNLHNGEKEFICNPAKDREDNIYNDGKCDRNGRFWVGTMNIYEKAECGGLYCFRADCGYEEKLGRVTISNGLAWSGDSRTMYYIDSSTYRIAAFDYDIESETISNKRTVIAFTKEQGMPDGMTIDTDGNLWVAMWGGWSILCCNPYTGEIIDRINIPVSNVTSCTFGGRDMSTLYITTARAELSEKEKKEQPLAGGIFAVDTKVRGTESFLFGKIKEEN